MKNDIGNSGIPEIDERRGWCAVCGLHLSLCQGVRKFFLYSVYVDVCEGCLSRVDRRRTAKAIGRQERTPQSERPFRGWKLCRIETMIRDFQMNTE